MPSRLKSAAATAREDGAPVTRSAVCMKEIAACEDWVQAGLDATTARALNHWSVLDLGFIETSLDNRRGPAPVRSSLLQDRDELLELSLRGRAADVIDARRQLLALRAASVDRH